MISRRIMTLRRFKRLDLVETFSQRNNPEIMKWCRQYAPLHFGDHEEWFEWQRENPKIEMFIVEYRISEVDIPMQVAVCGLTDVDLINRHAEFSLYVFSEHQKKGFGRESLKLLFDFGFDSLNLNRIWGETFDGNPAMNLFKKIGMDVTGSRPEHYYKNGKYLDAFLLSISREKWYSLR